MAGQNIGAGKEDRAAATTRFAGKSMFAVLAAVGAVVWLVAADIVRIFSDNPEVIEVGRLFIRYVAPTFGFTGVFHAYKGGFRGAGRTLTAAIISVSMLGVIRVPVAWVASREVGYRGIWLAFAVSNVAGAAIAYLWYARGGWRDADLTEGPGPRGPHGVSTDADGEPAVDD
jgi:Na+-driven multidrug efflux pump